MDIAGRAENGKWWEATSDADEDGNTKIEWSGCESPVYLPEWLLDDLIHEGWLASSK